MIRKYTPDIELKPGMFINCEGMMRNTFAGRARRIVSVNPKSVQSVVCGREDEGNEQKLKRLIQWVCDTEEEAKAMEAASHDVLKQAFQMEVDTKAKIAALQAETARRIIDQFSSGGSL